VEKGIVAERYPWNGKPRDIQAIDAATGAPLWEARTPVLPLSMAVGPAKVYFHDGEKIIALDRASGKKCWESPPAGRKQLIPTSFGATLVVYNDVIVYTGGNGRMSAYSTETGTRLWEDRQPPTGHSSPLDILATGGLIWNGAIAGGRHDGIFRGRDPHTGEVVREFPPDVETYWFHHRCYRAKATDRYLLSSRTGVEFIDLEKEHWDINHWVRGACVYGIMPCNGLLYAPQHPCICYAESKLNGFCALAPTSTTRPALSEIDDDERLVKGPVYDSPFSDADAADAWPTYRHDPARSGAASTTIEAELAEAWSAKVGHGPLSSLTVAGGRVYVASIDEHAVHAIDCETGGSAWTFSAGGRVDSPPTFYGGRLYFGSADGHVYCLRASDGRLIWRYRAAPLDLRTMSFEQIESVWPVHGAVLVRGGAVYCTAGRSMFLDGGIHLLRLDPLTGKKLSETVLDETDPTTGEGIQAKTRTLNMPVALSDVLSCDGKYVYMRSQKFDLDGTRPVVPTPDDSPVLHPSHQLGDDAHLFCPTGFLDDSWFHRGYWMYGRTFSAGCDYWFRAGRFVPAGRLLVFDDETVYGFGRKPSLFVWTPVLEYHLFAAEKYPKAERIEHVVEADQRMSQEKWAIMNRFITTAAPREDISAVGLKWSGDDPGLLVRAMALADGKLFVAGPPDVVDEEAVFKNPYAPEIQEKLARQAAALAGSEGAALRAIDARSGKNLATRQLPSPPVWDGMALAQERLYLATTDGKVICLRGN
jgi:outer membrane protein assembly factor BamB